MEKNVMIRTGKTATDENAIEKALFVAQNAKQRALDKKKAGYMNSYFQEISYYIGMKNALEMLGLVKQEDYDFNDLEEDEEGEE